VIAAEYGDDPLQPAKTRSFLSIVTGLAWARRYVAGGPQRVVRLRDGTTILMVCGATYEPVAGVRRDPGLARPA
jgi:hypothetical protein